jgi:hypothetical protein
MPEPAPQSIEDEVLGNILAQPGGDGPAAHTVADLGQPEPFLRRVADRIIRATFEERHRAVVAQRSEADKAETLPRPRERELRPALRGYRASGGRLGAGTGGGDWPIEPPPPDAPPGLKRAAEIVARRLSIDGLCATTCAALQAISQDAPAPPSPPAALDLLRRAGLPVDLLAWFDPEGRRGARPGDPESTVGNLLALLRSGSSAAPPAERLRSIPMRPAQSVPGLRIQPEAGERDLSLLRMQLTRPDYWSGRGDGGNLDMVRQIAERLPGIPLVIAMEATCIEPFRAEAARWKGLRPDFFIIVEAPEPISQWAHDNAKAGDSPAGPVLLTPRFPTRGEGALTFTPGESEVMRPLAAVLEGRLRIAQSPLLFQAGNLLAVHDPIADQLMLLAGEAEIHRNVALGLTPDHAAEALRVEFGADRCVVLPGASFHIDYEVTLRSTPTGVVAFVNDEPAAVDLILACGLRALKSNRMLRARDVDHALQTLEAGDVTQTMQMAVAFCQAASIGLGQFRQESAAGLAYGPGDTGIGNFHRFMLAMDFVCGQFADQEFPIPADHTHAYYRSLFRNQTDRQALHEILAGLGWKVVPVPAISAESRSISPINGLHERARYLMPAYGGLFDPLDQAALRTFRREMPGVSIVPVYCGESQRRNGSVHCSVSPVYAPGGGGGR